MPLPEEFEIPEGGRKTLRHVEESGEFIISKNYPYRETVEAQVQDERNFAARVLRNARKVGLRLRPGDRGGGYYQDYESSHLTYVPRDSKKGKWWRRYYALARNKHGDKGLGSFSWGDCVPGKNRRKRKKTR